MEIKNLTKDKEMLRQKLLEGNLKERDMEDTWDKKNIESELNALKEEIDRKEELIRELEEK